MPVKRPPAPKPPVDKELAARTDRGRLAGHRAERVLRDDEPSLERLHELQGKLRGAVNAVPCVREDVFTACDALERFVEARS